MPSSIKFLLFVAILLVGHSGNSQAPITPKPCTMVVRCTKLDSAQRLLEQLPLIQAQLAESLKANATTKVIVSHKEQSIQTLHSQVLVTQQAWGFTRDSLAKATTKIIKLTDTNTVLSTKLKAQRPLKWYAVVAGIVIGLLLK